MTEKEASVQVTVRPEGDVTVVEIRGSVDGTTADRLLQTMQEQLRNGHVRLVVDCTALEYTSSAGLGALLAAVKQARQQGGDLCLAAVRPPVLEVLELSGFTGVIAHFPDVTSAAAGLGSRKA
jgi:anti-sigma B factor antagonist